MEHSIDRFLPTKNEQEEAASHRLFHDSIRATDGLGNLPKTGAGDALAAELRKAGKDMERAGCLDFSALPIPGYDHRSEFETPAANTHGVQAK